MLKRLLVLALSASLLHAAALPSAAAAPPGGAAQAEKVKASVAKRVGKKSKVTVELPDGSKVKGYVSQAGEDSFTVTDKTGQARTLAYADVSKVHGQGLSKSAKIGIGLALVVGAAAILFVIGKESLEDSIGGATVR